MTTKSLKDSSTAAVDSLIALALTVSCLIPFDHLKHDLGNVLNADVALPDAMFCVAFIMGWGYCFGVLKLYDRFATIPSRMTAVIKGVCVVTVPTIAYIVYVHADTVRPSKFVLLVAVLCSYEFLRILFTDFVFNRLASRDPRRAIIVGSGRRAGKASRELRTRYHSSMEILGFVDDRTIDEMAPEIAQSYLGSLDDLEELILTRVVDMVLIAAPMKSCYALAQQAVITAERVGIPVFYLGDIYTLKKGIYDPNESMFTELAPAQDRYLMQVVMKRIMDVVTATVLLIILMPCLLVIALAIKLTSEGPVLFRQERHGYRRRTFAMVKFRTMVVGAEAMLPHLEALNEATGPIFKLKNDPRLTKIGAFLRRTSIDELPQLWNVVLGDMSLVGPRPMSKRDVSLFSDASLMRRFSVKAGMTGLWQVSGRSAVGFDEWTTLDNRYIDSWSLLQDVKILIRTVGTVLGRSGAM